MSINFVLNAIDEFKEHLKMISINNCLSKLFGPNTHLALSLMNIVRTRIEFRTFKSKQNVHNKSFFFLKTNFKTLTWLPSTQPN